MKFIIVVALASILQGCLSTRYNIGFKKGYTDYEKGIKTGFVKNGYAVGYVKGFHLASTMDDLEKSTKRLNQSFEDWRKERNKIGEEMDLEIEKALKEAFDEVEQQRKSQP